MKGVFITFEGPDGSGKTTQMKLLGEYLQQRHQDVLFTREPGGTAISNKIRELLLSPDNREMTDETEVLLYAAARAQHVREVIAPALARGAVVVCDRFIDASIAYQAYGLGQPPELVEELSRYASGGLEPDRTYMMDIPVKVSRERLLSRSGEAGLDRIEQKGDGYHERVREGFLLIAKKHPQRVRLINANRPVDEITAEIRSDYDEWSITSR